jgi:hypothetical protein
MSQAEQQGRAWAFFTVKVLREPRHTVNSASRMTSFRRGFVMMFLLFVARFGAGRRGYYN